MIPKPPEMACSKVSGLALLLALALNACAGKRCAKLDHKGFHDPVHSRPVALCLQAAPLPAMLLRALQEKTARVDAISAPQTGCAARCALRSGL